MKKVKEKQTIVADQAGANLQKAKYQDSRLREHKGKSRGKEKVVTQTENSEKVKEKQKNVKKKVERTELMVAAASALHSHFPPACEPAKCKVN